MMYRSRLRPRSAHSIIPLLFIVLISVSLFAGGSGENENGFSIGVFVPGQVEGSPTYELLVEGINLAAQSAEAEGRTVEVKILEAGFNQAEWGEKLQSLAATGTYDVIVSSNPSIPDLIAEITPLFPEQRFIVMDAENPGIPNLAAVMLDQYEQAYLSGYFAGLVSTHPTLSGANDAKVAGLIAGQEYPVMNNDIRPGFADGFAASAGEGARVEFRVLGNWFDAEKARELADSIIRQEGDVILAIAGSGNQGVVAAAESAGTYVLWYDSPGYEYAPGTVLGSSLVNIDVLTAEMLALAIDGELDYGSTRYRGIAENAVDYARQETEYLQFVPEDIRAAMDDLIDAVKNGELVLGSDN
jgi:basic membrane lipoprotein Med (substrate-binding protein (PBP1-ABC) superfamily)